MSGRIYLDWNATAPLRPAARAATLAALGAPGNASSVHREGRTARAAVEEARAAVAALVGAPPACVTFTSGATEANALALTPFWDEGGRGPLTHLVVSAIEHPSVLKGHRFPLPAVRSFGVTAQGVADIADLARVLATLRAEGAARPMVSLMAANNETGVVQPIRAAAELVHAVGGLLHVDAVQAAGRLRLAMADLGADFLTLSSHKLGGPQGAGALVRRNVALQTMAPLIAGGGQERGMRAGTENVAAIAGFGAAAAEALATLDAEPARLSSLRDRLEAGLRALSSGTVIFGAEAPRLPNTTLFAVPGIKAETALMGLDLDGVAVSSGAACSSGKVAPSHVLAAMGVDPALAAGALRVSTGPSTQESDVAGFLQAWRNRLEVLGKAVREIAA